MHFVENLTRIKTIDGWKQNIIKLLISKDLSIYVRIVLHFIRLLPRAAINLPNVLLFKVLY